MSHVFILGAPDAEMDAIEQLLKANGYPFAHALFEGRRVRAGNAYRADGTRVELARDLEPVFVECAVPGIERNRVIDHHRAGDPGYDCGPSDYWAGSSLGQAYAFLGIDPTEEARIVAAADHCPAAAYRGLCPGVDPQALRLWRRPLTSIPSWHPVTCPGRRDRRWHSPAQAARPCQRRGA